MEKSQIKIGEEYGVRRSRQSESLLEHVRILEHVRGKKWKAEWIDPNPGLKDYVESQDIVVRWKEHKAFLRDEENERRLDEQSDRAGYVNDEGPIENALSEIFESVGDGLCFYRGVLSGNPDALTRVKERARMNPTKQSPFTYVDRHGRIHAPLDEAVEVARAFCAAEPNTVLTNVEATEQKWSAEASQPGGNYLVSLLNKYRASWAIIRQWTGADPAIAQREARIQYLERLVLDAIYELQKAGLDSEAHRLRRAISGR